MADIALIEERLTQSVIGAFYEVYNDLRFGFHEHVYVNALERELLARGHDVAREIAVEVAYKQDVVATQRLDMVVDNKLVVEVKSTLDLHKSALRQLRSYLHATRLELGLLLHFGPEARFYRLVHSNDQSRSA